MEESEHQNFKSNADYICENSDDEPITLSENTLKALHEFYQEQELRNLAVGKTESSINLVEEDWELSQFWYDEKTALILKDVSLKVAGEKNRIACISCPTIYTYIVKGISRKTNIFLFEYDKRFKDLYKDHFIFYNYNDPLTVPDNFKSFFDLVLVDPPYLSTECLEKIAATVKLIAKDKIILCTGAIMEELAFELLGLKPCALQPQHERKLGNEFKCYTNFNVDEIIKQSDYETK